MKLCIRCKETKEESEFNKNRYWPDGYQKYCRVCHRASLKATYEKNPTVTLDRQRRLRDEKRAYVWDYLQTHPCVDCGEKDPLVLDFDHKANKTKAVSVLIWSNRSVEFIRKEIKKCAVRCANCHRRKTARELGWYKWKRSQSVSPNQLVP